MLVLLGTGGGKLNLKAPGTPDLFESEICEEREGRFIRLTGGCSSSSSDKVKSITSSLGRFLD